MTTTELLRQISFELPDTFTPEHLRKSLHATRAGKGPKVYGSVLGFSPDRIGDAMVAADLADPALYFADGAGKAWTKRGAQADTDFADVSADTSHPGPSADEVFGGSSEAVRRSHRKF